MPRRADRPARWPATPRGCGYRRPLCDQELPGAGHRQDRLLADVFDRHDPHVRASHRFADRLRIVPIVFVILPIGGDELRRDQPHVMAQRCQFARPAMRTAAGFSPDETRTELCKERAHLRPGESTAQDRVAALIDAVQLKDMLVARRRKPWPNGLD